MRLLLQSKNTLARLPMARVLRQTALPQPAAARLLAPRAFSSSACVAAGASSGDSFILKTYTRPELKLSHGKGSYVYDTTGKEYLDFTAGIAVVALGHSHPDVSAAIADQATKLIHCSNLYHNEWAPQLAQALITATEAAHPSATAGLYAKGADGKIGARVFFSNSGTEANEGALKFARKYGKHVANAGTLGKTASEALRGDPNLKSNIVSFTGGFHGRSMGALSVTANPKYQKPFTPLIPGAMTAKYNRADELAAFIDERTCGVIVEPVQGEGGIHPADVEFLRTVRRRCDQVGAVLIYDEIQCGLGRTGSLWAHHQYPVDCVPDIVTMAKPLANGVPIGAIMVSEKIANVINVGDHGTTFGGNPLACRVGCTVLGHIAKPAFLARVQEAGKVLAAELEPVLKPYLGSLVVEQRGMGLLRGIQFASDPTPIVNLALQRGLLLVAAAGNTIRLVPPLNIENSDLKKAAAIIGECIAEASQK